VLPYAGNLAREKGSIQAIGELEPGKQINIVRPDHGPQEFLEQIVLLIRGPDRAEAPYAVRPAPIPDNPEVGRDHGECLIPRAVDQLTPTRILGAASLASSCTASQPNRPLAQR
jgi:hypothetical protein